MSMVQSQRGNKAVIRSRWKRENWIREQVRKGKWKLGGGWHTPLIPAFGRQRQADF